MISRLIFLPNRLYYLLYAGVYSYSAAEWRKKHAALEGKASMADGAV